MCTEAVWKELVKDNENMSLTCEDLLDLQSYTRRGGLASVRVHDEEDWRWVMADTSVGERSVEPRPGTAHMTGARSLCRRLLLVASAIVGVGVLATALNAGAAGATSAHTGHWCDAADEPWRQIFGTTVNHTEVALRSVYREKGWGSTWDSEPTLEVAPEERNRWCNEAAPFPFTTAAMKAEYALTHGDKVVIEAWIGFFGDDAKCYIVGQGSSVTCRVIERDKKDGILSATFEVSR